MPLIDKEAERAALAKWKAGDSSGGAELLRMHSGLIYSLVKRYVHRRCEIEDLMQIGSIAMLRAATEYREDVSKFSTYAFCSIRGPALIYSRRTRHAVAVGDRALRVNSINIPEVSLDASVNEGEDMLEYYLSANAPDKEEEHSQSVIELLGYLSETEREILVRSYFGKGEAPIETLDQIGKMLGVSKQRVHTVRNNALARLRKIIEQDDRKPVCGHPRY